jgi:hypothetical protein
VPLHRRRVAVIGSSGANRPCSMTLTGSRTTTVLRVERCRDECSFGEGGCFPRRDFCRFVFGAANGDFAFRSFCARKLGESFFKPCFVRFGTA